MNRAERLALVDHDDPVLPVAAQCRLLKVARSTLYHQPVRAGSEELAVMRGSTSSIWSTRSTALAGCWRVLEALNSAALRPCTSALTKGFDKLPDQGDTAFAESLKSQAEESPIRTFKEALGDKMYDRLIRQRLAPSARLNLIRA